MYIQKWLLKDVTPTSLCAVGQCQASVSSTVLSHAHTKFMNILIDTTSYRHTHTHTNRLSGFSRLCDARLPAGLEAKASAGLVVFYPNLSHTLSHSQCLWDTESEANSEREKCGEAYSRQLFKYHHVSLISFVNEPLYNLDIIVCTEIYQPS